MRILAIETATPASSVALGEDGSLVAMSLQVDPRGHVGFLMPAIDFCFAKAGWDRESIDVVAVDVGPGPYTGLRAGISAAQAIAAAVGVPIVTTSSLTVLAFRAATGRRRIWPVVDVRRGQVATAPYLPVPGGVMRDGETELVDGAGLAALLESDHNDTLLVGDWSGIEDDVLRGLHRSRRGRPRFPSAEVLLEIADMRATSDNVANSEDVRPIYLREPDARINWSDFREEGLWPGADGSSADG
jgi:tRNA threonylcarbamoyladenosine biosynthesis protein TsaB